MNCRTHEHRHFERILRACSCSRPTLVSGSVACQPIHQAFGPALSGLPAVCLLTPSASQPARSRCNPVRGCCAYASLSLCPSDTLGLSARVSRGQAGLALIVPTAAGITCCFAQAGATASDCPKRCGFQLFFGPNFNPRPDIKGGYPPNLSILISGGKENNCDSLSNGE